MIVVALVGHPFSGKRTLAKALSCVRTLTPIEAQDIGVAIAAASTPVAAEAKDLVGSGIPLPDAVFGALLAQVVAGRDAILIGRPRNLGELLAFTQNCAAPISLFHLRASEPLIDARRAATGLPPIESEHPGALRRLDLGLAPVLDVARQQQRLLELDAALSVVELVERAGRFLDDRI